MAFQQTTNTAYLVTNNPGIHGRAEDGFLCSLYGDSGITPVYLSKKDDLSFGDNSLVLVDLCSFHPESKGLSDILRAISKEHHTVIGVNKTYTAHYPGFKPLNGYGGIDCHPLQRMLRKP